jgi:hypothetical protein
LYDVQGDAECCTCAERGPAMLCSCSPGGLCCLQLCLALPIRACKGIMAGFTAVLMDTVPLSCRGQGLWRAGNESGSRWSRAAHRRATTAAASRACCPDAPAAAPRARTSAPPPLACRLRACSSAHQCRAMNQHDIDMACKPVYLCSQLGIRPQRRQMFRCTQADTAAYLCGP